MDAKIRIGLINNKKDEALFIKEILSNSLYEYEIDIFSDIFEGIKNNIKILIIDVDTIKNQILEKSFLLDNIKHIPSILLINSMNEEELALKCIEKGIDYYIIKSDNIGNILSLTIKKLTSYYKTKEKLKRIEESLEGYSKHLEKFRIFNRNLIQSIPLGVLVTFSNKRLININDTAKRLLNLEIDNENLSFKNIYNDIDLDFNDLSNNIKSKSIKNLINIAFDFEQDYENHNIVLNINNKRMNLDVSTKILSNKVFDKNKKEVNVKITIFKDITTYTKMEEQLFELKKIASLGHLSAGIAHEIRNPLTSMNMFCSYILESFDEPDERKKIMEKVVSEIKRLENLVKGITSYARTTPINNTMINLYQTVENTLFFVNQYIKKKNIIIKNFIEKDFMIFADLERIKQVVINVFINSINSMEQNGILTIKASKNEKTSIIEVIDTGCGIPEKIIHQIYDPFFTTNSQSSGLGLSIVQKIISLHNGEVKIINRNDGMEGTVVKIVLPRMGEQDK